MALSQRLAAELGSVPELAFAVDGADVVDYAVAPTLGFRVRIGTQGGEQIRSISLNVQIRIAVTGRSYDAAAEQWLAELYGPPERWGETMRSLLWTNVHVTVPAFTGSTVAEVLVPCTYDFEVAAAKYFHALDDGEVPVELLFSGTIFYAAPDGRLRIGHVSWNCEATYRLPVRVWKQMMERYFPRSAFLRLSRETFDRLYAYRLRETLPSWESTIDALLPAPDPGGAS